MAARLTSLLDTVALAAQTGSRQQMTS
jgi:hypothetical protein